jgi:hypothetical protein
MILSIVDRIVLLNILPKEGNHITLRIVSDLRSRLSFSEEELAKAEFIVSESGTKWKHDIESEIEIGPKAFSLIFNSLESLNRQGKLTLEHLPLYDRFVTDKD